jgi:hypothetical protein
MAKQKQRESVIVDRTVGIGRLWKDISIAIGTATTLGIPRVTIIENLLLAAENECTIAKENNEDLSALEGLLS